MTITFITRGESSNRFKVFKVAPAYQTFGNLAQLGGTGKDGYNYADTGAPTAAIYGTIATPDVPQPGVAHALFAAIRRV